MANASEYGGAWTNKKLDIFIDYLKAYTTILNSVKHRNNWKTIYFDGFAGYGERKVDENKGFYEHDCFPAEKDYTVFRGSVKRVLSLSKEHGFDYYYFIDKNRKYISELNKIRGNLPKDIQIKVIIKESDCNTQLSELAKALRSNPRYRTLLLLDPFGMQINWNSIEQFKQTKSDVWILVPTGIAINRLLDRKMELRNLKKLETFFGLSGKIIEEIFYHKGRELSLFGDVDASQKINRPIKKIVEIYIRQLKTIWEYVTTEPLKLTNSRNCPIFHFIFASNNKTGYRIASQIINKK
jgi:three-Cys-motif partner protein